MEIKNTSNLKVLAKIQQARYQIKHTDIKKKGRNTFAEYEYFTPDQISAIVFKISYELKLFNKFDLHRTEYGLMASLTVFDLESNEAITFSIAMEMPSIKATNAAQQLGGAATYAERYLSMIVYDIKDNNLDFDTTNNTANREKENKKYTGEELGKYQEKVRMVYKKVKNPDDKLNAWISAIDTHSMKEMVAGIKKMDSIIKEQDK